MSKHVVPGQAAPAPKRRFDQTYLSEKKHGRNISRDYAAHFFRWGYANRYMAQKRVLDVGCGKEVQLLKTNVNTCGPTNWIEKYVGVDLNQIDYKATDKRVTLLQETNFIENAQDIVTKHGQFDTVTCFEVLEHMDVDDGKALLQGIKACLREQGIFLLSTPVNYGQRLARNHVKEYSLTELSELLEEVGFSVKRRFGTYGNVPSIAKVADQEHKKLMKKLQEYYHNDVVSVFLAPLYPDQCKNNLWVLEHA